MAGRVLSFSFVVVLLSLVVGCGAPSAPLTGVSVTPTTVFFENNSPVFGPTSATAQMTATGTYSNGKNGDVHYEDITNQVAWESSITAVATVSSTGLVTPAGCGITTINAKAGNAGLVATASVTVCNVSGGLGSPLSLKIMAPPQTLSNPGEKAQYIAVGTYAGSNETKDLTNQVKWSIGDTRVATINSTGLVTAASPCSNIGSGPETTITAVAPGGSGSSLTETATFAVGSCGSSSAPTLTVHEAGEGLGMVISNPAGIGCSGGEGCTGNFSLNAPVTLTASPNPGSIFGGFSASCTPVIPDPSGCPQNLRGSDVKSCTCATRVTNSGAVGAIFNTLR
jgi:Bacterial Ig-like domain (group 2)